MAEPLSLNFIGKLLEVAENLGTLWECVFHLVISRVAFLMELMPRLHLPYDEYTMPVRYPNHRFRAASAGRLCDHRTDLRAS